MAPPVLTTGDGVLVKTSCHVLTSQWERQIMNVASYDVMPVCVCECAR